jgi:hypothetical protein
MKKLLLTAACGLVALSIYAQGTISFVTVGGGVNAPATNVLTSTRVSGTGFLATLFWASGAGRAEADLVPVADAAAWFGTGSFAGYIVSASGGGNRILPSVAGGTVVTLQVRAWDASLGSTWEVAYQNWLNDSTMTKVLGRSNIINATATEPPNPPGPMAGLLGFNLVPVPEPSILALGILGGLGVLLLRRRK